MYVLRQPGIRLLTDAGLI